MERLVLVPPGIPPDRDVLPPGVGLIHPSPERLDWARTQTVLARGVAVAELDVRPLGTDEHASKAALVLGRPMVGMGAYDITRFVDYLAARPDIAAEGVSLWAEGLMALPALFALALDERVARGTLVGLLSTYVSPVPVPHPTWTFAHGLLQYADIDHLVALVAPRPVVIADPVGADLRAIPRGDLRKMFPAARRAFGRRGRLRIRIG
jgi:hypothetical protein